MATYHLTVRSSNAKTGPIPVSTTSSDTCPDVCPLRGSGCYADSGPLALHWKRVSSGARGGSLEELCTAVREFPEGQLWRHNQAGDLPGDGDLIDAIALLRLVAANVGRRGFTYTHKPPIGANAAAIADANARGFTVNLSANNLAHADELAALGIGPVAVVLPTDQSSNTVTPGGRRVVICPATQRDDVSCATCKLCASNVATRPIVGFPAHGSGAKRAVVAAINFHPKI